MDNKTPLIEVRNLKKYFDTPGGKLHAVDNVNFTIDKGKTLGVVGESGCGKSTMGRVVLGLIDATSGQVLFDGRDTTRLSKHERSSFYQDARIIFQDPYASLNPRMCVSELIAEPLKVFKLCKDKAELDKKVAEAMDTVGLASRLAMSYPHELDGGRRQRIGIARAIVVQPKFIVCDEPVSALDVSIQAQVLNLLQDIQAQHGLTYMFITHDLSVVKHISDDILVMYLGCMVEKCDSKGLFINPLHPYTKGLLSAIPIPVVGKRPEKNIMRGELTSPIEPKDQCRFLARCPYAGEKCKACMPELEEVKPGHFVACHYVKEINNL